MLADTLRELNGKKLVDTDGDVTVIELAPPATPEQLRQLEARLPAPLPDDVREALLVTTGFAEGPLDSFSLLDLEGFGLEELFPDAYSLAHDGFGNYWVLDMLPETREWGPVYFACHDPPVIAYQAPTVDAFVRDLVALAPDDPRSPIDQVHEGAVNRIWREHPGVLSQPEALGADDSVLREFANTLPPNAMISDLRDAQLGDGFAWGRYGPRTTIIRCGTERIWAVVAPPHRSLLSRLFGR